MKSFAIALVTAVLVFPSTTIKSTALQEVQTFEATVDLEVDTNPPSKYGVWEVKIDRNWETVSTFRWSTDATGTTMWDYFPIPRPRDSNISWEMEVYRPRSVDVMRQFLFDTHHVSVKQVVWYTRWKTDADGHGATGSYNAVVVPADDGRTYVGLRVSDGWRTYVFRDVQPWKLVFLNDSDFVVLDEN